MAQREAVLGKLSLQVRSSSAALDAGSPRDLVHLGHLAQAREVDRDRSVVTGINVGLHPTDHARAAPVGDRRDTFGRAPLQQQLNIALVTRRSDEVRRMFELT